MSKKTFPLHLEETFHREIKVAAFKLDISINKFIQTAIREKLDRMNHPENPKRGERK